MQLLAVKPQQLDAVAQSSAPAQGRPLLISVLAGVSLDRLQRLFPGHCCVRAVPNTPALVGAGLTALAWSDGVNAEQRRQVYDLFGDVGEVLELPESKLDAFLALTSSGPAFIALVAEAMADGAVLAGLPRDLAQRLAHRTWREQRRFWIKGSCILANSKTWWLPPVAPPLPAFDDWSKQACALP